jgi:chromosomal replication initiator protein
MHKFNTAAFATTNGLEGPESTGPAGSSTDMNKNEAYAAFERVQTQLKARLGSEVHSSWFGRLKLAEASKSVVRLSVPTPFLRAWITNHYLEMIAELWRAESPSLLKVEVIVRTAMRAGGEPAPVEAETVKPAKLAIVAPAAPRDRRQVSTSAFGEQRDPSVGTA